MKKFLKIKSLNKNKGPASPYVSQGGPVRTLKRSKVCGFTIIEIMVSIAVFLIVISIGINSLLNIYYTISNTKKVRSLVDSLSFTMEEMSRNIRVGYDYVCLEDDNESPTSCDSGAGCIYFTEAESNERWGYRIIQNNVQDSFRVEKTEDGGSIWFTLIGEQEILNGMRIDNFSGFMVFGAENNDDRQPLVILKLVGDITYKSFVTPFSLQTSVSQMYPDTPE